MGREREREGDHPPVYNVLVHFMGFSFALSIHTKLRAFCRLLAVVYVSFRFFSFFCVDMLFMYL